jgi:hypothetical protein
MDDDRSLAELADEPLDHTDATALQRVRELYDVADPLPADLVDRVRFALALDEVFDEVARMSRVPLDAGGVRGEPVAGTRTETLTFSADRLTAMVTVSRVGPGQLRLDGWLAPPTAYRVRLRVHGGGTHETAADEDGRFSFDGLEDGFGQLSFHPAEDGPGGRDPGGSSGPDADNAVVTPLFQL